MIDLSTTEDFVPATPSTWALLSRVLSERGIVQSPERLRDDCAGDGSAPALARALVDRGVDARVVELSAAELRYLAPPSLLATRSGWVVLRAAHRKRADDEEEPGAVASVPMPEIEAQFLGSAIAISDLVLEGGGLSARVFHVIARRPKELAHLGAIVVASSALAMVGPALTQRVIDHALPEQSHALLAAVAVATASVALHRAWLGAIRERVVRRIEIAATFALSAGLFDHALRVRFSEAQRKPLGESLQALAGGAVAAQLATGEIVSPLIDLVMSIGLFALLAASEPRIAMMVAVAAFALGLLIAIYGRYAAKLQERAITYRVRSTGLLAEIVSGIGTLKSLGVEAAFGDAWLARIDDEQRVVRRQNDAGLVSRVAGDGMSQLTTSALFLLAGIACLEGRMTIGELSASAQYASSFFAAVVSVASLSGRIASTRVQVRRARELLATPTEPSHSPKAIGTSAASRAAIDLRVDDVWFRHDPDAPWILRGVSLGVPAGDVHLLRSASGSGKTTLLRLIAGLYVPERGAITLGGLDARIARERVAYVPQDATLFEGSILENLELLSHGAPRRVLLDAAERTGLADLVRSFPMLYETRLPPGGGTLSGGQRQLLVFTACVASSRPLILLDEALCHMDRLTQQRLLRKDLFRGRTVIAAMHEVWTERHVRGA